MPVGFVFDQPRLARLRRTPQTIAATLDLPHPSGRERRIRSSDDWRVRGYRIESRVLDGEGKETGKRMRTAASAVIKDPLSGERKTVRAVLTIVGWEDVVVYGDEPLGKRRPLSREDALLCGYLSVEGLRGAWRAEHPSAALARLYRFQLEDRRDRIKYLASTRSMVAGRQGDYTGNAAKSIDPDAPLLTDPEYAAIAMQAQQKDTARRRKRQVALATSPSLAERVARIESGEAARIARRELEVISQKAASAERRLDGIPPA